MNLATQSRLFALFLVLMTLGVAKFYLESAEKFHQELENYEKSGLLVQGIFELNLLANEYLAKRSKKSLAQWNNRHSLLISMVLEVELEADLSKQVIAKRIRSNLTKVRTLFFKIVTQEHGTALETLVESNRRINKIGSQARLISQQIVADAHALGIISRQQIWQTEKHTSILIQATLASIIFVLFIVLFWVHRSFLAPILLLKEHSLALIKGDYLKSLSLKGKDELSDLCRSFDTLSKAVAEKIDELTENSKSFELSKIHLEKSLDATKSAELRYSAIFSSAQDCIILIDEDGIITSVNPATEAIFGYRTSFLIGKDIEIILLFSSDKNLSIYGKKHLKSEAHKKTGVSYSIEGMKSDGTHIPLSLTISEMEVDGIISYSGILRDISEEMQAKENVLQMNRQLEKTVKELNDKTQVVKISQLTQGANNLQVMCNNIVATLAELIGAGHGVLYVTDDHATDRDKLILLGSYASLTDRDVSHRIAFGEGLIGQCAKQQESIHITQVPEGYIQIHSGLGAKSPSNILIAPIMFEGQVKGVIELASFRRFSDAQRELIDVLMENIGIAINGIQKHAKTLELLKETRIQSEELQAQREELQAINESLEEQTQQLKASEEELKNQSEELRVSNEELEEKSRAMELQKQIVERAREELEIKTQDLAQASQYKSEFLANMSHELRTPLNSFLLLSKNLADNKKGNLDKEQLEDLHMIYGGGLDLLNLINDIMDLSKVEAGKLEVVIENVDMRITCENALNLFRPSANAKELAFAATCEDSIPVSIRTDSRRLDQILKNFLSNAFKFTASGSIKLHIHSPLPATRFLASSLSPDNTLAFSVIDTGIGIPQDKLQHIFETFQQQDGSTSRKYGGTGLGLTISRELTKLLGGEIQLMSEVGKGSTFTLYLPIGVEESEAPRIESIVVPLRKPPVSKTSIAMGYVGGENIAQFIADDRKQLDKDGNYILIIEDDKSFARMLLKIVRNHGYQGLVAGDGKNGLYLALEYQPKGIFLDLGLPDMDGRAVLEQLKFHLRTKHIPVHVISGRQQGQDTLKNGAIGFLQKPASEKDIDRIILQIQRITSTHVKTALIVEGDVTSQQAIVGLIQNKGIQIECVGTGIEAIERISSGHFDCVIMDIALPDISGFEMLERLSKDISLSVPPIIIYTGQELSLQQRDHLQRYAATIVLKNAESPEKLLDEALLFMHSMTEELSSSQKKAIFSIHDQTKLLQNRKILLVDDDVRNTFALSRRLQEVGLSVTEADNGQAALNKLEQRQDFELIIMDIMMPIMDGYEAMRCIRKMEPYKKIPMIALTAKAMSEDRAKCIEAGATDYLTKPLDFEKLLSMIKVWLFRK